MSRPCSASAADRASSSSRSIGLRAVLRRVGRVDRRGRSPRRGCAAAGLRRPRTCGVPGCRVRREDHDVRRHGPRLGQAQQLLRTVLELPVDGARAARDRSRATGMPGGGAAPRLSRTLSARLHASGERGRAAASWRSASARAHRPRHHREARDRRRQHVDAARSDGDAAPDPDRQVALLRQRARDLEHRAQRRRRGRAPPAPARPPASARAGARSAPPNRTSSTVAVAHEVRPDVVGRGGELDFLRTQHRHHLARRRSIAPAGGANRTPSACGSRAAGWRRRGTWRRSASPAACTGRPAGRTRAGGPGASRRCGRRARRPPPGRA